MMASPKGTVQPRIGAIRSLHQEQPSISRRSTAAQWCVSAPATGHATPVTGVLTHARRAISQAPIPIATQSCNRGHGPGRGGGAMVASFLVLFADLLPVHQPQSTKMKSPPCPGPAVAPMLSAPPIAGLACDPWRHAATVPTPPRISFQYSSSRAAAASASSSGHRYPQQRHPPPRASERPILGAVTRFSQLRVPLTVGLSERPDMASVEVSICTRRTSQASVV
jgi:hypothetical protein